MKTLTARPDSLIKNALLALLLTLCASSAWAKTVLIYHTSDIHGYYYARDVQVGTSTVLSGGLAAIAAQARTEKEPVLFLDSGDWFQGTPEGNFQKGLQGVLLLGAYGVSAAEPGNHEFDYGEDNFRALASSAPFAAVNCNIYDRDTGKRLPYLKPWVIVESNGVKIGVTGVLEPLVEKTLSKPLEHLNIREPAPEVLKVIPEMKKAGAQAYVVLAHMGIHRYCPGKSADQCEDGPFISSSGLLTLARALKGKPALVFGGHMHKQQPEGYSEGGVWVAESGELAKTFTRAALEFGDKSGKYEGAKMKVLPSDPARYGQDPKVLAAVRALTAMAGGELDTRLAENRQTLGKALFSQWMTDVYRAKYGTDLAFAQSSSIRRELAAGTLTGRDIYLTIPYENTMMLEELKGADVLSALRDNFSFSGRKHMMFSGMEAEYDLDKEGKLLAVRAFVDGKPLDPDKYYTVALNSYLLSGVSYGQAFLRGRDIRDTGTSIRQPLLERLSKDGELRYQDDGRARQTTR